MQNTPIPPILCAWFDALGIKLVGENSLMILPIDVPKANELGAQLGMNGLTSGCQYVMHTMAAYGGIITGIHMSMHPDIDTAPLELVQSMSRAEQTKWGDMYRQNCAGAFQKQLNKPDGDLRILVEDMVLAACELLTDRINANRKEREKWWAEKPHLRAVSEEEANGG